MRDILNRMNYRLKRIQKGKTRGSDRAVDRGMIDATNLKWLKERGSRYIVGTPKGELKRFEQELLKGSWSEIREGLEPAAEQYLGLDGRGSWKSYMQLTETEAAFRIQKDELRLRPIWHQIAERVQRHFGVFSCIRPPQDAGRLVATCRLGPELTDTLGGIRADPKHRCGASYYRRARGAAAVRGAPQSETILLHHLGLELPKRLSIPKGIPDL